MRFELSKSIIALLAFTLLLSIADLSAQRKSGFSTEYVPGIIMLKLETDDQIRKYSIEGTHGKIVGPQEVESSVRSMMQLFGLESMERVMDSFSLQELQMERLMKTAPGAEPRVLPDDLTRTFTLRYSSGIDPQFVASKVASIPGVAYAEPKEILEIMDIPNDPLIGQPGHNYFNYQNFPGAWAVTKSSEDIIIAIVDSGVDYNHPDLAPKLWRNPEPGRARNMFPNLFNAVVNDTIGWNFWESGSIFSPVQNGDPMGTFQSHGTHVAGTAAAATNNGIGIAGTGYNSSYMAIRAGGTQESPRSIGFGYEGILYAAVNGAHVINCSFGGGGASNFGRDIVEMAIGMGSVIVAAAGNSNEDEPSYPASFDGVISVASVNLNSGVKSGFSTYHSSVSVSATGSGILSTVFNNNYGTSSGTSMAAPVVAGLAALMVHHYPDWDPLRIKGQIVSSANASIYNANQNFRYKLGGGLLDAENALTNIMPSVRIVSSEFVKQDGSKIGPGETGVMKLTLENTGEPTQNLSLRVSSFSNLATISGNNSVSAGAINTGESVVVEVGVSLVENVSPGDIPEFVIDFNDTVLGYDSFTLIEYDNIFTGIHDNNNARVSVTSTGGVGFDLGSETKGGVGFIPLVRNNEGQLIDLPNMLYEAGIIVEFNYDTRTHILSNVRTTNERSTEFRPLKVVDIINEDVTTQLGNAHFEPNPALVLPDFDITMNSYALSGVGPTQGILVYISLTNREETTLAFNDVYIGMYSDWDIFDFSSNSISWSESDSIMIAYSEEISGLKLTTAHLGGISGALAIDNAYTGPVDSLNFGVYYSATDANQAGFTNINKSTSLKSKTYKTEMFDTDISMVTASGPFTLMSGETATTGFFFGFGVDEDDLRSQVALARASNLMEITPNFNAPRLPVYIPTETEIVQNYPNPFNPSTTIVVDLARIGVARVDIYDVMGRFVTTVYDGLLPNRRVEIPFDARGLSSGKYFIVLTTSNERRISSMTLLK